MNEARTPNARTRRRWRPLRWLLVSLLALLEILIITIYFLPNIVSSKPFRSLLESRASQTLQRPVHIEGLRWTWSNGISVRSFRIDDDPAFPKEPLFSIKNIVLKINLSELLRRRLNAAFSIEGLNLRFIRNRDGVTNVGTLLSTFPKGVPKEPEPRKTLDEWRKLSFSLPFEVQARVALRDMSIRMEDRSRGRTLTLDKASLSLEITSFGQESLSVRTASDINLDGTSLPPLRFDANVRNLFTPKGQLRLSDASVVAEGSLPGMTMDVKCDLRTPEMRNKVQIDLPRLVMIVRPFLPPSTSNMDVTGVMEFIMNGSGDPMKNLRFTTAFSGQDLGMTGGPFKKSSVGPLRFRVTNEGEVDLNKSKVTIDKGEFRFLERSAISWHGSMEKTNAGAIADVTVGPISIDLDEVYRTAKPFLPEDVGLNLHGLSRAHALTIGTIKFSGPIPKGLLTIVLDDLTLRVPMVNLKQKEMSVSSREPSLSVNNLRVVLKDLFPSQANGAMTLHIDDLRVGGPKKVIVQRMDLPSLEISASDIQREKEALFGVTGRIALKEGQSLGVLSVPEIGTIRDLKQSLLVEVSLRPAKSVDVDVKEFKMDSPSISATNGKSSPTKTPFSISTTMSMALRKETDYEADIKRLRSDISVGKILRASMDLTAERWGFGGLRTEGSVHADLSQVMGYVPPEMGRNLRLSGLANMGWSFAGRLPGKEEMEGMKEPEKALALLRDRDIIRELHLTAGLKAISVRLTTADGKRVSLKEISTPKPLRVVMEKGSKKMNLSGAVSGSMQELPYLGNLKEPLRVAVEVSGIKADMNRRKVTIDKGEFRFLERSAISWHGSMEKTNAGAIADVTVGPISIDLDEVYRTAKPFLPEDVGLNLHGLSRAHALTIGTIKFSGPIPKGLLTIVLDDLTLRVPMVNLKQKEMSVSSRESSLSVNNLRVVLKDLFPSQANGAMTLHIDDPRVGGPQGVPYLGNLKEPLRVAFDVSGNGDMLKTFTITQSLRVSPLNLKQEARISVSGLDKLMSKGQNRPLAELLESMGGKAKLSLDLGNKGVSFGGKNAAVAGKIAIGADIDLLPRREIGLRGWMQAPAPGLDLTYGKLIDIKNLKSSLAVAKRYRLSIKEEGGPTGPLRPYLSVQVLKPPAEEPRRIGTEGPVVDRLMSDMRAKGGGRRTFSAESVHVGLKPLPIDITHPVLDFSLEEGFPSVDFFQTDIMGGTVRGSLSIKRRNGAFVADLRSTFSGLNAQRLISGPSSDIRDEEAEVSGMLWVGLPLSTSIDSLLQDMEFELELTHIGTRALERMLYALDPYENNESMVRQRKVLRMGSVRWVRAGLKDGMLSTSGQVEVKGVKLELPRLERLNVGSLPGLGGFEKRLSVIGPAIKMLNILSANTIVIEKDGKIKLL